MDFMRQQEYEEAQEWMDESLISYIRTFGKDHSKVNEVAVFFSDLLNQYLVSVSVDFLIARYENK